MLIREKCDILKFTMYFQKLGRIVVEIKNYARDFDDRVLKDKYEQELYHNKNVKSRIKILKEDMIFYSVAAVWFFCMFFFTKLTIFLMALFMYLNYKLECLNMRYFYHVGIMFVVMVLYLSGELVFIAVFVLARVLVIITGIAYILTAIISILKYLIFTKPVFADLSKFFNHFNLGVQRIESDEKLYRLESEVMERQRRAQEAELTKIMKQ